MARIIDRGDFAEIINDEGVRLICSTTVDGAQALWQADGAAMGRPDLISDAPLPVIKAGAPVVYRVRNNPTQRGFYAAAYASFATDLPDVRDLRLLAKMECSTKRAAERAHDGLKARFGGVL